MVAGRGFLNGDDADEEAVVEFLSNIGQGVDEGQAMVGEVGGGTDAGEEEEFGCVYGAGGKDDFFAGGNWDFG